MADTTATHLVVRTVGWRGNGSVGMRAVLMGGNMAEGTGDSTAVKLAAKLERRWVALRDGKWVEMKVELMGESWVVVMAAYWVY
jgi:hypothetical protein